MRHQARSVRVAAATRSRDVRIDRTRQRLASAVIGLASERDIASASVSELAQRAGINRTTFYEHAESPVELLNRTLKDELDEVRNSHLARIGKRPREIRQITRHGMLGVIEHVERHEAIYGGGHTSSFLAVRMVLADHITNSALELLEMGILEPVHADQSIWPMYAAHYGHGVAASIEAWLKLPMPRDRELLLDAIEASSSPWIRQVRKRRRSRRSAPPDKAAD